jgi:hypothetical protein
MRFAPNIWDRSEAIFLAIATVLASPVVMQQAESNRDIPSIARDALKSVVTIVTKDEHGKQVAIGSGFVVSGDGKVVTNFHVIEGADSAEIAFADGASYSIAGLAARNLERDLVILKIKSSSNEFRFLRLADSDRIQIGEQVVAVGSPLGLEATVAPGFISGVRDAEGLRLLQTTAPISPGSSGGALINLAGEVVGVPALSLVKVQQRATVTQNLNFALPSNYVRELLAAAGEIRPLGETSKHETKKVPERSPAEMIATAKTICVWVQSGNAVLKTEMSGKLLEWGKLKLVSDPNEADLVLKVVQTGELNMATGEGNQATVLLTDRESGTELWSKTKGGSWAMSGWSNAAVARALAKEFIKFVDSSLSKPRK